jgi:hypothetical protein
MKYEVRSIWWSNWLLATVDVGWQLQWYNNGPYGNGNGNGSFELGQRDHHKGTIGTVCYGSLSPNIKRGIMNWNALVKLLKLLTLAYTAIIATTEQGFGSKASGKDIHWITVLLRRRVNILLNTRWRRNAVSHAVDSINCQSSRSVCPSLLLYRSSTVPQCMTVSETKRATRRHRCCNKPQFVS